MAQTTNKQAPEPSHRNIPLPMDRAEYLVDLVGTRLGLWTNDLGHELQRLWARAREEGEDIWAEANDLRSRTQPETALPGKDTSHSATPSTAPAEAAKPTARAPAKKPATPRKSRASQKSSADEAQSKRSK